MSHVISRATFTIGALPFEQEPVDLLSPVHSFLVTAQPATAAPAGFRTAIYGMDRRNCTYGVPASVPPSYASKQLSQSISFASMERLSRQNRHSDQAARQATTLFNRFKPMDADQISPALSRTSSRDSEFDSFRGTPARARLFQLSEAVGEKVKMPYLPMRDRGFIRRMAHRLIPKLEPRRDILRYNDERQIIQLLPPEHAQKRIAQWYQRHQPSKAANHTMLADQAWATKQKKAKRKIARAVRDAQTVSFKDKLMHSFKDKREDHTVKRREKLRDQIPIMDEKNIAEIMTKDERIDRYLSDRSQLAWNKLNTAERKRYGHRAQNVLLTPAKMLHTEILNTLADKSLSDNEIDAAFHRFAGKIDFQHVRSADDRDRMERGAKQHRATAKLQAILQGVNFADWTTSVLAAKF